MFSKLRNIAALGLVAMSLTACVDINTTASVSGNGIVDTQIDMTVPVGMYAMINSNSSTSTSTTEFCGTTPNDPVNTTVREYFTESHAVCERKASISLTDIMTNMKNQPADSPVTITQNGSTYRIELDLSKQAHNNPFASGDEMQRSMMTAMFADSMLTFNFTAPKIIDSSFDVVDNTVQVNVPLLALANGSMRDKVHFVEFSTETSWVDGLFSIFN